MLVIYSITIIVVIFAVFNSVIVMIKWILVYIIWNSVIIIVVIQIIRYSISIIISIAI